jgi:multicomponent Na+:H+ antiporter subunit B
MTSLILSSASRLLVPLMLVFSLFLLLRGHSEPGGGFVGGLVATAAFGLEMIARDVESARRLLRVDPRSITAFGLLVAAAAGLAGLVADEPFLTGQWVEISLPLLGKIDIGTPLLFDVGVFFVVVGVTATIILALAEE